MKIAVTFLTYGKNVFGGIERAVYNFTQGLKDTGFDIVVYTSQTYVQGKELDGVRVYASPYLQTVYTGNDEDILAYYRLHGSKIKNDFLDFFYREKPDVVVSVDHLWGVLPVLEICVPARQIVWLHVRHNDWLLQKLETLPYELYCVSQYLLRDLGNVITKNIDVLPNSVIYKDFQGKHSSQSIIFCNARISREKRVLDAVKVFAEFQKKFPNFQLHLTSGHFPFGSTKESLNEVNDYIVEYGLFNVFLHKALSWSEIPHILSQSSVVLLPSAQETFGMAALEALAAGIPLVATRVGNLPDLIRDAGYLVQVGDTDAFLKAVYQALRGDIDTDKGRTIAREYDYRSVALNFVNRLTL